MFRKRERITSQKLIDLLFDGSQSKSFVAYPVRVVWSLLENDGHDEPVQVLMSVPKKRLHHAVDRNRAKRQMREAYRLGKQTLVDVVPEGKRLVVGFIWISDHAEPSALVAPRMGKLLARIAEKL